MDLSPEAVRAWRERLATISDDVFEIMDACFAVAAQYRKYEFPERQAQIAERLLGNRFGFGGDNFTSADSDVPYSSETVQGPRRMRIVIKLARPRLVLRFKMPVKQRGEDEDAAETPAKQSSDKTENSVAGGEGKVEVGCKTGDKGKGPKSMRVKKKATNRNLQSGEENSKKRRKTREK